MQTQIAALQAAISMLQSPQAVQVADHVLRESGFVSRSENEHNAQIAQQQAIQQQQQQQQQLMQQQAQQQAMQQQDPNQQ